MTRGTTEASFSSFLSSVKNLVSSKLYETNKQIVDVVLSRYWNPGPQNGSYSGIQWTMAFPPSRITIFF